VADKTARYVTAPPRSLDMGQRVSTRRTLPSHSKTTPTYARSTPPTSPPLPKTQHPHQKRPRPTSQKIGQPSSGSRPSLAPSCIAKPAPFPPTLRRNHTCLPSLVPPSERLYFLRLSQRHDLSPRSASTTCPLSLMRPLAANRHTAAPAHRSTTAAQRTHRYMTKRPLIYRRRCTPPRSDHSTAPHAHHITPLSRHTCLDATGAGDVPPIRTLFGIARHRWRKTYYTRRKAHNGYASGVTNPLPAPCTIYNVLRST
jgi:hypothetical protein